MKPVLLNMCSHFRRLLINDHGQDTAEYALVIALVCFGASASLRPIAGMINVALSSISADIAAS